MAKRSKSKTKKRAARRRGQELKNAQLNSAYRRRLREVMVRLGLSSAFDQLKPRHQRRLMRSLPEVVRVRIDEAYHKNKTLRNLQEHLVERLNAEKKHLVFGDACLSLCDVYCALLPLSVFRDQLSREDDPAAAAFCDAAHDVLADIVNRLEGQAWDEFLSTVLSMLTWHYRIDRPLLLVQVDTQVLTERFSAIDVLLSLQTPEKERIPFDGQSRIAYRLGISAPSGGIGWIQWSNTQRGDDGDSACNIPIFVQEHALIRLAERARTVSDDYVGRVALYYSFDEPRIVKTEGDGTLWIAAEIGDGLRLGYFLANVVDSKLLVRTFKFITMQGSPEASRLREQLRLNRYEIERLRLDQLATFMQPEIFEDRQLAEIFTQVGLGHLFELAKYGIGAVEKPDAAPRLRRFFRLDQGKPDPTLPRFRGNLRLENSDQ